MGVAREGLPAPRGRGWSWAFCITVDVSFHFGNGGADEALGNSSGFGVGRPDGAHDIGRHLIRISSSPREAVSLVVAKPIGPGDHALLDLGKCEMAADFVDKGGQVKVSIGRLEESAQLLPRLCWAPWG